MNVIACIAGRYLDEKGDIHNVAVFAKVIRWKDEHGCYWYRLDNMGVFHG